MVGGTIRTVAVPVSSRGDVSMRSVLSATVVFASKRAVGWSGGTLHPALVAAGWPRPESAASTVVRDMMSGARAPWSARHSARISAAIVSASLGRSWGSFDSAEATSASSARGMPATHQESGGGCLARCAA